MYRTTIVRTDKPYKAKWLLCQSDTPYDVYDMIRRNPVWAHGGNSEVPGAVGDGWANTKDLGAALELGRFGWEEGVRQMVDQFELANVIRRALPRKTDTLDVGGMYPVVPLAVAGDPQCMVTLGDTSYKTKPVVRVVVNVAVSGSVTAATIIRRGAAILSWVDAMEGAGIRCEIEVVETGLFHEYEEVKLGVMFSMTGKLSHEPLDIDRMSFLLAHPAVQRRIFFACYEREEQLKSFGLTQAEAITYGSPTDDLLPEWIGLHSVYFPAMMRNNPDYASPANAVAAVERMIMKSLQSEDVAEDLKVPA